MVISSRSVRPLWSIPLIVLLCGGLLPFAAKAQALAQAAGLEAALRSALSLHPAISGKQALVEAKGFGSQAVRSQRYPTLSAQALQYDNAPRNGTGSGPSTSLSLRARQPLWAFGRIDSQIAYADADAQSERTDLHRVQRQLIENTARAYATVLSSRQRLHLATEHSQTLRDLHAQIQRREQGQLASRADVSLAATRLAQARAREQRFEGDLAIALSELLALTQQPIGAEQPVPARFTSLPEPDTLLDMALSRNADMAHKQQLIERARAAVGQVRTSAMPTIFLQAEQLPEQSGYRNDRRISLVLEGALEGMGLATQGQTRAAQAQLSAAQQELLAARNDAMLSVRRLISSRQMLQNLIATQATSLIDQATLLASYKRQYEAGTKSWLDLLNTQREMNEQQLQQVQAESDWLTQSLQLMTLTGGFDALTEPSQAPSHE